MRKIFAFLAILFFSSAAFAALHFPTLTGRVVDDAHILSPSTIQRLDQMLANYEAGTTNQVVVVTLQSLQGTTIEDYGYQLGRYWAIGQKGKDNGVLLIIAPHERKVRIEVGYGVESTLTDAMSSEIIQGIILPDFKQGQMETGIVDGTQAIIATLGGKSISTGYSEPSSAQQQGMPWVFPLFLIILIILCIRYPSIAFNIALNILLNSIFRSGSGSSGGGFSGGGGSFGGGGASGSW